MKKYTQSDFDNFEIDDYGYRICPSGDYDCCNPSSDDCKKCCLRYLQLRHEKNNY